MAFSNSNQTVLITGASSGIGRELARIFARDGYNLILVNRDIQRLNLLASELREKYSSNVKVFAKDLTFIFSADEIFAELTREGIHIDILVNNAGVGVHGPFAETDLKKGLDMLQINMLAPTHLTRLFLPAMIQKKFGKIMNVASTAAFQPGPLMAGYFASKAYVLSFSEALANELDGSGVTVTTLCPGPTATEFQKTSNTENIRETKMGMMSAEKVAQIGYKGLMRGKTLVIPGFMNKVAANAVRFLPRKMVARMARWVEEKPDTAKV